MSAPHYPRYKETGVPWLGPVPAHWDAVPLKRLTSIITDKAVSQRFPVALENIESWTGRYVGSDGDYSGEGVAFQPGDILFGKLRPYLAKAWVADKVGEAIGDFHVLRSLPGVCAPYFRSFLLSSGIISVIDGSTYGAKMPRASWEFMGSMVALRPPLNEQQAIAAFLDRETAKIDVLVAEQERLLVLLEEKRQAVIANAVTKGVDPTVPMKDSGVEWLGQVPAHWKVTRLSALCVFSVGKPHEPYLEDDGPYVCVTARFVSTGGEKVRRCTQNLTPAKKGDVLLVMSDLPNGRALAKAFLTDADNSYAVNQRVCALTFRSGNPRYLFYQMNRNRGLLANDDGMNQTHLSNSNFTRLLVAFPSNIEQDRIVAFVDKEVLVIDDAVRTGIAIIALLNERRTALISAAVTGKLDVRVLAPATEPALAAA